MALAHAGAGRRVRLREPLLVAPGARPSPILAGGEARIGRIATVHVRPRRSIVEGGILLVKFWLEVSDREQKRRFEARMKDPLPLPITLAHELAMKLAEVRKKKALPYLGPDGKTQVTVEYRDGKPARVDYVVIAASHIAAAVTRDGRFTTDEAKQEIVEHVVRPVVGNLLARRPP